MKHIIFGIGATLIIVMILMNTVTIEGLEMRERDMKNALHAALEEALSDVVSLENYNGWDDELLIADVTALLMERLNANDKNLSLELDVAGVDAKAGLLSVHVKETFTYPNGRTGEIEDVATVVLENEMPKRRYEIVYTLPSDVVKKLLTPKVIKSYYVEERDRFPIPKTPDALASRGMRIVSWLEKNSGTSYTNEQLSRRSPEKDMKLEAVVRQ